MKDSGTLTLGICCGATTISMVELSQNSGGYSVRDTVSLRHEGNPKRLLSRLLAERSPERYTSIAVTGRRFRHFVNLTSIPEPLAVESAIPFVSNGKNDVGTVISAGGETFMVYEMNGDGKIGSIHTGNKCASGTGEFFLQQIRRLNVDLDQAVGLAQSEDPHPVSGRCSVFCKSDCTHATNKGVPKGRVVAGLCRMMAGKVLELLKSVARRDVMLIGGVAQNPVIADYIEKGVERLTVPKEAPYFEALGAAVWAAGNGTVKMPSERKLFKKRTSQFDFLAPLTQSEKLVTFSRKERGQPVTGDTCILGVDVGSTTTKAVLLRQSDLKILASEYLRTNGEPVEAARRCYRSLLDQLDGISVEILGLGVTGSGRKIVGLHGISDGVINEIIAHATAAIHFDPEVDTIFEIGGQDAKYTHITGGVASDYAMNEACSAGTGSFLEESAYETLGIRMEDIASWAMKGGNPPNFNDQCAAFISSDIKNALNEGIAREDIVAGVVYSVCMNYVNRVKGSRPVGSRLFMQGGVCYNRAVPIAMAALTGKRIVVPPEPGLIGAFGVALEVNGRLDQGLMEKRSFDLRSLADREVVDKGTFRCPGGVEKCDLGCEISRVSVEGKTYPFGGICNRYHNLRNKIPIDPGKFDFVAARQKLVFEEYAADLTALPESAPTVGINRSFLTNTYFPLFSVFFRELGMRPVLSPRIDPEGVDARTAPFCFPCEISHGWFKSLLDEKPAYLFLPHLRGVDVENGFAVSNLCPLLQGEPFYLKSTFEGDIYRGTSVLTPMLDLSLGPERVSQSFVSMGVKLGYSRGKAETAVKKALETQNRMFEHMYRLGREILKEIESDPDRIGVVLLGRSYNAFAPEINKGIPHKFASRGFTVIPMDFLDAASYPVYDNMYWSVGQVGLKVAEKVKAHPQLFGTYITNFSCGPDSFLIGYFRRIMGGKPSLTLELDNHTADAGLETRIEAYLDIVRRYRTVRSAVGGAGDDTFRPAKAGFNDGRFVVEDSDGERLSLFDPRVRVVLPSMGPYGSRAIAAACGSKGVNTLALPEMVEEDLKVGKGNSLCKECLPLQFTTGAFLRYIEGGRPADEVTLYFMPTTKGPCRFGQYQVFMRNLISDRRIPNVTTLSLSSVDNYAGLDMEFILLAWYAVVVSDVFEDIRYAMHANAENPGEAVEVLEKQFNRVLESFSGGLRGLHRALKKTASTLGAVPMVKPLKELPRVLVAGEVYVRKEDLARRRLPERLAREGFVAQVAPLHEWFYYIDWLIRNADPALSYSRSQKAKSWIKYVAMRAVDRSIKRTMVRSGWYLPVRVDMNRIMKLGEKIISRDLYGEAILTVSSALVEAGHVCGVVSIGPFGCMPNRLAESILSVKMKPENLVRLRKDKKLERATRNGGAFPFLSIESDGGPFTQLIEAQLEVFILQARRMHGRLHSK